MIRAGVMGWPVGHSLSPRLHGYWLAHHGIDGDYRALAVAPEALAQRLAGLADEGLCGGNLTLPHKPAALAMMASLSPAARAIGAVNTVVVGADGSLAGDNTDAFGFMENLRAGAPHWSAVSGPAVVLGAGGAARAIAFGLVDRGADVSVCNRTVSRAETLAGELGCAFGGLDDVKEIDFDILVNTTPLGMHPDVDASPIAAEDLRENAVVFDTIYNPLETKLLKDAKARGCRTLDGLSMFVGQGAAQFRLWTGRDAPVDIMRNVCLQRLGKR